MSNFSWADGSGVGAGASASFLRLSAAMPLTSRNTQNAIIRKSIML